MSLPVIVLGAGGHSKVLVEILLSQAKKIVGIVDPALKPNSTIYEIRVLGNDMRILDYDPDQIRLVNGLGSVKDTALRKRLFTWFKEQGYHFETVIHKTALLTSKLILLEGCQIMAGTVIQTDSYIGKNTIINTKSCVEHDCVIEDHVHIAPGVTICGGVKIGEGSHVGAGATIIQGIQIGKNCLIGAGAVVTRDVPDGKRVLGVPAREV